MNERRRNRAASSLALLIVLGCEPTSDRSALPCPPGLSDACYSGPAGTEAHGTCRPGVTLCFERDGGIELRCLDEVLPVPELCDELDNDCDGEVDNQGACAEQTLAQAIPPGLQPLQLETEGRVGPVLLQQEKGGALFECADGEDAEGCAQRFLQRFGAVYGAAAGGSTYFEIRETRATGPMLAEEASGSSHVLFEQRFGDGLRVAAGGLSVHIQHQPRPIVVSVSGHALPVRADTPQTPTIAAEALPALLPSGLHFVATDPPEVWVDTVDPNGAIVPVDAQRSRLSYRVEASTTPGGPASVELRIDATSGAVLKQSSLRAPDIIAVQGATPMSPAGTAPLGTAMCGATGCPTPLISEDNDSQATRALRAGVEMMQYLTQELAEIEGPLGPFIAEDFAHEDLRAHVGELSAGCDGGVCCPDTCDAGPPRVLGYTQPAAAQNDVHLCCLEAEELDLLEEVMIHEVAHRFWFDAGFRFGTADLEVEASEHALTEILTEFVRCESPALWDCDFVHAGRDYRRLTNPADLCNCDACVLPQDVAQPPSFALCPAAGENPQVSRNRLRPGHALTFAACLMTTGCEEADCRRSVSCGEASERRRAMTRLARLMYRATYYGHLQNGRLLDFAAGLLDACRHGLLESQSELQLSDCAALQSAFQRVGITESCALPLSEEVCDGIDNDCDGYIDNMPGVHSHGSLQRDCYDGPLGTLDVGACRAGHQLCVNGAFAPNCIGQVTPQPEQCDGVDDNCNHRIDDGARTEFAFDGDGDGWASGLPRRRHCPGEEPPGFIPHVPGPVDCDDGDDAVHPGAAEVCSNDIDDNCDGIADEGCPCGPADAIARCGPVDDAAPHCVSGQALCLFDPIRRRHFRNDACWGVELGGPEVCDGLDNDCDGVVDNNVTGLSESCGYLNRGKERCVNGRVECSHAEWRSCSAGTVPPTSTDRLMPRHIGSGDGEFAGHGPSVTATASISIEGLNKIVARIWMLADEAQHDWTKAEGRWARVLAELPSGCEIVDMTIPNGQSSSLQYRDTDHSVDLFAGDGRPVLQWEVYGDHGGTDVGEFTSVIVHLRGFGYRYCCPPD